MIRIAQPADPLEAQLLLSVLEAHGIRAVVQGEALWGARGELPFTPDSGPSLWVADEADAERAREILKEHKTRPNPSHCPDCGADVHGVIEPQCPKCAASLRVVHTWTCQSCNEVIGTQFTHCWNCGAEKSDRLAIQPLPSNRDESTSPPPCPRCGGTGQIERHLFPAALLASGLFLGFTALHNAFEHASYGVLEINNFLQRALFAAAAAFCLYFAWRLRQMPCPCRLERPRSVGADESAQ